MLKAALKEKYPTHSAAFDAVKKPDAEVLTKEDFSDYKSVNIDTIFQEAGAEQLSREVF